MYFGFRRAFFVQGAVLAALGWFAATATAAPPGDAATRAKVIGQPKALTVEPASIVLDGSRGMVQPVITGRYADGSLRDLTHFCDLAVEDAAVVSVDAER